MRLGPLPADQWDAAVDRALSDMLPEARRNPAAAGNGLATLVRHPALVKAFLQFNVHVLMQSTLPARIRELAILRVAHRAGCDYEWFHHVGIGMRAGLSEQDIADVRNGEAADEFHCLVVLAVDELLDASNLSDHTWSALSERFDERQCMDLVFTIGCYNVLAMAFNAFGVEVEENFEGGLDNLT
ncbi:carboxymuconolactone decarboxylase [Mycobacterium mantenii]|uniref:Carboxymuconolactone decarboxylase n=1 Tax=Mycobacterium mantenii TaxID=560555 RepID=A0A1X0FT60_MYCNT|nr:carboxymuconolactone decarboxylase family protein [Mycobacterium mantenii]MCV7243549.1 carboxymuconolactone decarboxylase family protein [Mycobacterium mantenii]ORB04971.1 carboxymuconolactone decarboxylase [Mycobacterium mantenii]BBY38122.1 carboxymuconolactone decarboxylase [Mycobacterium mantenii]